MANFGFIIDNRRCIGCHACTVACKAEHDVPVGVNRTWVKYIERGEFPNTQRLFSVMRCNHCDDAPCVEICPVSALYTRADGIVDFDNRRCIGCKACMQACPYDALYIDPQSHTAAKCNYCAHRIDVGLEPACVNVCPTQAIISGDLDDPQSRISVLRKQHDVKARKTEKGTRPALFYIDGETDSLDPLATPATVNQMWNQQSQGVGHFAPEPEAEQEHVLDRLGRLLSFGEASETLSDLSSKRIENALSVVAGQPRRAYDAPQKGILWGWEVTGYLWTKSIAAGVIIVVALAKLIGSGLVTPSLEWFSIMTALIFLAVTGLLLVADLDKPARFSYVLLRPQWKSWLVRGAWIITGYSVLLLFQALFQLPGVTNPFPQAFNVLLLVSALLTAVYTAFLFGQAKGREFWRSRTVPLNMVTHAIICGAAFTSLCSAWWNPEFVQFLRILLIVTASLHLVVTLVELLLPHENAEVRMVTQAIISGRYRWLFWWVAMVGGTILPLVLLIGIPASWIGVTAVLLLIGVFTSQHIWVRAPQQVPLS